MTLEVGSDIALRAERTKDEDSISVHYARGGEIRIKLTIGKTKSEDATLAVSIFDSENHVDSLPRQGVAKFAVIQ